MFLVVSCNDLPSDKFDNNLDPASPDFVLPTVINLNAVMVDTKTINIGWNTSPLSQISLDNLIGLTLFRRINSGKFNIIHTFSEITDSYTDSLIIIPDSTYTYALKTTRLENESEFSDPDSVSYTLNPPANASVKGLASTEVNLSWDNFNSFETLFSVYIKSSQSSEYEKIADGISETEFLITGLDTNYVYDVRLFSKVNGYESNSYSSLNLEYKDGIRKKSEYRFSGADNRIARIAYSDDGNEIIAASRNGNLHFFDSDLSKGIRSTVKAGDGFIYFISRINEDQLVIVDEEGIKMLSSDGYILEKLNIGSTYDFRGSIFRQKDNNILAFVRSQSSYVYFYNIDQGMIVDSLYASSSDDFNVKFSRDGSMLAMSLSRRIRLITYPEKVAKTQYSIDGNEGVWGFDLSPNLEYIIISGGGFTMNPYIEILSFNGENKLTQLKKIEPGFHASYSLYAFNSSDLFFMGNSGGSGPSINIYDPEALEFKYQQTDSKSSYSNYFVPHPVDPKTFIESGFDDYIAEWSFNKSWFEIR